MKTISVEKSLSRMFRVIGPFIPEGTVVYKKIVFVLTVVIFNCGCTGKTSDELYADGVKALHKGNSSGAIVLFRNALDKNQNNLDARYQLAKAYVSVRRYELAEKEFQKVKLLNPKQREIKLDLAKLYNYLGKPDLAISQAQEHLAVVADSADALEVIGSAYGIKKMPQEAENFFLRALQIDPGKVSTKLELAALLLEQGKAEEARELLDKIVEKMPANTRAVYLLADAEIKLGRKAAALALYKKLAEINPADPVATYKAGLLHFDMGHFLIAETIAGDLVRKFPASTEGYRLKGIVSYHNKNFPEAITALQNANKILPSVAGYYFLGLSLYGNGDLESALSQFRRILDRAPSYHQARLLTGMILLQQRRVDDAIAELTKLIEADERNPHGHYMLGNAYMAKGLYEEGMKELDVATRIEPRLVDAYMKKGMFHLSQGKTAEVEMDLNTAIRIAPEILNTRLILSSFYEHHNQRAKAISVLQEGLSGNKSDAVLQYGIARIMFADKKPAEAIRYLKKAKECDPGAVAPYFILAGYYVGIRDVAGALNEYAAILKKEPGNVKAMLQQAALLESSRRDGEALTWYLKAKETRDLSAYLALSRYYEKKGDPEKPLSVLVEASRYIPRSADLLEQKVRLYLKKGQYKEALKTCDDMEAISAERAVYAKVSAYTAMKKFPEAIKEAGRAIDLKPDSAAGYVLLATAYRLQNKPELAIETLKKAVRHDGGNPQPALLLAGLYSASGNHAQAQSVCDEILQKRPNYAPAYFTQGTFLEASGNKEGAIKKYRAALALSKEYATPYNNLAYLYLDGHGTKEEALKLAESAIALDPGNPVIMDTVGYALLKNGRHQEAREYLERALVLLPGDPTINHHLALLHQASGRAAPSGTDRHARNMSAGAPPLAVSRF
ncbi:MAG: PEP-CTERM system TPR-repeat protein PrsT [Desulfuromonadaceae bacterium]|nr:PEP-CTERM system TPR-repeat protein PrsT [Desulfuromonadaceae bacterium]MDD2848923.1 PEP-CTERM system TPR-repeat protein PrsT [Desulfuromonadaceae bacterium]MDD4131709.1 PEP-CTERM system TPR-repeat protein PrsT [Desulfuromonadaceae bacterium]